MKPSVEKVGSRIHLRSEFKDKDLAKGVIGARWSPRDRVWTYPLEFETCRRLRDAFGLDLEVGPELWAWAEQARVKEDGLQQLVDISKIDLTKVVDLPIVRATAPTMWAAMQDRPYQPVAAKYMADAHRCLNADQPGIGKTIETLAALIERGVRGPVLVLAPKTSCLSVWPAEIERWLSTDVPYSVTQTAGLPAAKREAAYAEFADCLTHVDPPEAIHFLIANAEQVRIKIEQPCPADICNGDEDWCPAADTHKKVRTVMRPFLHDMTWNAIVADETHKWLINTRGKRASQVGYGFTRLKVTEEAPMYALTGTPLKGKKWNLFGTINWLWPKTYTSKWRWIGSYFEVQDDKQHVGRGKYVDVKTITGKWKSPKAREEFYRHLTSLMIRRTKDELRKINPAWMPPEKRYHDVYLPMEGSQRTHYRAMEKDAKVMLGAERLTATGILAEMTRLKQFALCDWVKEGTTLTPQLPSNKFDWLLNFLSERGIDVDYELSEDVQKVVVAMQYTTVINMMAQTLRDKGIACYVLTGETKDQQRVDYVKMFQTQDNVRVFFINTTAGGVSITLDAADDVVMLDETWVPDESEQVEDRAHRASNVTHQVDVWYVRSKDSIEEAIAALSSDKALSNHVVLDAQRGLRFAAERFGANAEKE